MARRLIVERRRGTRRAPDTTRFAPIAVLRPGKPIVLIDLSPGGALIQSPFRASPGSRAELQLFGGPRCLMRGRIDRCRVSQLDPLRYEAVIVFDEALEHP